MIQYSHIAIFISILSAIPSLSIGQNYKSYFIGNTTDTVTTPARGVCLMGGAGEDDNAAKWFLQQAGGGDVLVLRTSGSDGYNAYFYSGLGVTVNSVETIVFNNKSASSDPYVLQQIDQAEAIWFAGGDQWTYISYWRNTPTEDAINQAISERNIVIGGTSAGMAIQGKYYFTAQNGTVTSAAALANPFNPQVTVDSTHFIANAFLHNTITDTHFDNPGRKGRLVVFLARIYVDYGVFATANACDEYTAVCIDTNGIARVFGGYPKYNDNAYFIQTNCELENQQRENCTPNNPLTWDLGGLAIKTYQVKGDSTGNNTFDLKNWQSGTNGAWYHWSVSNGVFTEQSGTPINCLPLVTNNRANESSLQVFPNPTSDKLIVAPGKFSLSEINFSVINNWGRKIPVATSYSDNYIIADLSNLPDGLYFIQVNGKSGKQYHCKIIKN